MHRFVFVCLLSSLSAFAPISTAADGEWQALFDGQSLNGWEANESAPSWVVRDGAIVTNGPRSHLFYVGPVANHDFRNFEFCAEVKTAPWSNSGIYFHTRLASDPWPSAGYEAQVINSTRENRDRYTERKMTGSIYGVRNTWRSPAQDGVWFEYRIKVSGRTIQTFIDGVLVCQYTESSDPQRSHEKPGRYLSSGTFALQCHDPESTVQFRNIRVRLLPDDAPTLEPPLVDRELDRLITQFSEQNVALIDFGLVADSAMTEFAQAEDARRLGVTPGYQFPASLLELSRLGNGFPVFLVNDRDAPPAVPLLQAAKANGAKLAFSSGGVARLDPDRLKQRLLAMREAGIEWRDMWIPQPWSFRGDLTP